MRWALGFIAVSLMLPAPTLDAGALSQATCIESSLKTELRVGLRPELRSPSREFTRLRTLLSKLSPEGVRSGKKVNIVMGAVELGEVPDLTTVAGKPLNIAAGGISTVINDMTRYYPQFLKSKAHGELTAVGLLMDGISTDKMKLTRTLQVKLEGQDLAVGVYQYLAPNGVKYYFLDNPAFKRLTVTPGKGESVYTFRGLEAQSPESELETQRIWSTFNQAISQIFDQEKGDIYVPHDYHTSPASFYIRRDGARATSLVAAKPLVHNERYVGHFKAGADEREAIKKIWNLTDSELNEYFMHGEHFLMLAPAVRLAEQNEIFTAMSVADGSAEALNHQGSKFPDFFGRVQGVTNGLGEENRPHLSALLAPAPEEVLRAEGITHPEVIEHFKTQGYRYGFSDQKPEEVLVAKKLAKADFQKNMGLSVDLNRPLFVGFSRFVYQKGMTFVAQNVRHILDQGGQIVVGGPVGDSFGEAERKAFLELKQQLVAEHHRRANDFVFIDGPVKGRLKGLMLAAGDFFLIPSRYEPCGLTDCEALMHGTIALAHKTGGLTKGQNTILYSTYDENDQTFALGEAIRDATSKFMDRKNFEARQLAAMREDFSVEKNFDKFAQTYRIEIYGKMILELELLVQKGQLQRTEAENILVNQLSRAAPGDRDGLIRAIKMMHAHRRSSLAEWLVSKN